MTIRVHLRLTQKRSLHHLVLPPYRKTDSGKSSCLAALNRKRHFLGFWYFVTSLLDWKSAACILKSYTYQYFNGTARIVAVYAIILIRESHPKRSHGFQFALRQRDGTRLRLSHITPVRTDQPCPQSLHQLRFVLSYQNDSHLLDLRPACAY